MNVHMIEIGGIIHEFSKLYQNEIIYNFTFTIYPSVAFDKHRYLYYDESRLSNDSCKQSIDNGRFNNQPIK